MDLSILLGVAGIVVSIAVGFGTFSLADSRARHNRWQSAKDMILRDLSKSLGEGNAPEAQVINGTIRSVLRAQNASDLTVVTLGEIADDLLRQITADPFIDAERRRALQQDVLKLRQVRVTLDEQQLPSEDETGIDVRDTGRSVAWSTAASLLVGILASVLAGASLASVGKLVDLIQQSYSAELPRLSSVAIAAAATLVASVLSLLVSRHKRGGKTRSVDR